MKNKKAWIRIVESVLAIMILSTFLFIIANKQRGDVVDMGDYMYNLEKTILREIEKNETLRKAVIEERKNEIEQYIDSRLPDIFNFTIRLCPVNDVCGMGFYVENRDIYANSVLISSTLEQYEPKQLKLFVWEK